LKPNLGEDVQKEKDGMDAELSRRSLPMGVLLMGALLLAACGSANPQSPAVTQVLAEDPTAAPEAELMDQPTEEPTEQSATEAVEENAGPTLSTAQSELGTIVVDGEGYALYILTADDQGVSSCSGACLDFWPPLTAAGEAQVEAGLEANLLGTISRDDGSSQVSYNGWPLYYFADDSTPGDTKGQGLAGQGGTWYVLASTGEPIGQEQSVDNGSGSSQDGAGEGEDLDDLY
jgi:predicted lipoprotein with Yx(FWY)xxD motif